MKFKFKKNGFTIIELMIGITIGLLTLLVIVNTVIITDKQKKQTASSNDAQSGGQISSYYLNRDLRMAGYGLTGNNFNGCSLYGNAGAVSLVVSPVRITAGADDETSDEITLFYTNTDTTNTLTKLMENYNGTNDYIKVDNRYGFMAGDLVILYSSLVDSDSDGIVDCSLAEITSVPNDSSKKDFLYFQTGNYLNKRTGKTQPATYNLATGNGIAYATGAKVINLGDQPVSYTYKVVGTELKRINNFTSEEIVLADNVYLFKSYFIKDADGNFSADSLDQTNPALNDWQNIIGVKFSVVTKSATKDTDLISEITTIPATKLSDGSTSAAITKTLSGDDRYFRYKTFSTIVPLRNVLWKE